VPLGLTLDDARLDTCTASARTRSTEGPLHCAARRGDGQVAGKGFNKYAVGQAMIQTEAPRGSRQSWGPASGDEANVIALMTFVSLSFSRSSLVQGFNFLIPGHRTC
jgi:hypothetical protein